MAVEDASTRVLPSVAGASDGAVRQPCDCLEVDVDLVVGGPRG